ncbi:MAG: hypothetical protein P4L10_08835, partial [Acidobacteriaceae bacterium]|nr:hypothetical protein [Acidobacteriaceae bacterium]
QWVPWGISFLAIAILSGRWGDSRLKTVVVLCGSLTVIVVNSYWTGGRATILFGIVPLLMCITRLKKQRTAAILPMMLTVLVALMIAMTSARSEWRPQISEDIVNIVDWHAGRFSMVGLGFTLTANSGYGLGSTLLEGISRVVNDTLSFTHSSVKIPHVQGITSIIGVYLLNDPDNNSIPPGSICELYYNFGVLGVILGHYLIGRLVRICSDAVHRGATVGSVLLGACCLLNISISTFSGTLSIAFYYLAFNGLPLLTLCWLESLDLRSKYLAPPPRPLELSRSLSSAN